MTAAIVIVTCLVVIVVVAVVLQWLIDHVLTHRRGFTKPRNFTASFGAVVIETLVDRRIPFRVFWTENGGHPICWITVHEEHARDLTVATGLAADIHRRRTENGR